MTAATTLAASVQAKKGRLYAVIQVRENGRTKPVWRALGLPEGSNKSKVNKAYREVVQAFEQSYAEQIAQNKKPASDIPIYDYMCAYFKKIEKNIQKSTAESYRGMTNGRIRRYFTARQELTVGSITAKASDPAATTAVVLAARALGRGLAARTTLARSSSTAHWEPDT